MKKVTALRAELREDRQRGSARRKPGRMNND